MQSLTNWNTFFKLWLYFTALDVTLFMLIANIYINGYLKYKNKKKRKQCEIIWKPVYDEYRRIGYRLKKRFGNGGII